MVKIIGPLGSHDASGHIRAPRIFSSSLRNRHDREAPPAPPSPTSGSLHFISTSEECKAPTINDPNRSPGTLETWIKQTAGVGFIVGTMATSTTSGVAMRFFYNYLHTQFKNTNGKAFALKLNALTLNVWTHIATTWNASGITLWVGGINVHSNTTRSSGTTPYSGFDVGGQFPGFPGNLKAYVTRIRFSDIIRYTANFTPPTDFTNDANTLALWRMTEGAGDTVSDESTNGHTLNFPAANKPTWSLDAP